MVKLRFTIKLVTYLGKKFKIILEDVMNMEYESVVTLYLLMVMSIKVVF